MTVRTLGTLLAQERNSPVAATLRLTRETTFAFELRRGVFDIEVDGKTVGSIKAHDAVELPLDPGQHTLQIRHGRYKSQAKTFTAADDSVINYRCHGAVIWPTWAASFLLPRLAISLKPT
jgi:hypothetical protein